MKLYPLARVVAPLLLAALSAMPVAADGRVADMRTPLIERLPAPDFTAALPATAQTEGLTQDWLTAQPAPEGDAEWQCLTEALYFEARGESLDGQIAVAEVILNRKDSGLYPGTVCGVVKQRGGGGCQFSYVCDGKKKMRERDAADLAGRIARAMLDGAPRLLTDGATHFHTRHVRPGWSKRFAHTTSIGAHLFYRQPSPRG
ncbi:cell wall hydrolase [Tabrizicola aquatica]|uniref:cell wall hydrolase n=1 Tax=Tabrizicola aquatica TaxID=909926 RepID=UPI000CD0C19C|nr:cell wall hydrolase [Tabrizicola aquatica]